MSESPEPSKVKTEHDAGEDESVEMENAEDAGVQPEQPEQPFEDLDADMNMDGDGSMPTEQNIDMAGLDPLEPEMMTMDGGEMPAFDPSMDASGVEGIERLGARRDKSLKEFLNMMDEFTPIIPDAVTDYYLMKAGFESSDVRIKRLLALTTQKFVSDIATDAYQYSRIRSAWAGGSSSSAMASAPGQFRAGVPGRFGGAAGSGGGGGGSGGAAGGGSNSGKVVLTMEDLASALAEYGLNVHRPEFYR
ncbi:transcription initiation factor TFIID 23-30kDa subunit-domain-containing protein [Lipomyces arxii]|uniref:transcription initiation factor TFIID 23-30kDa subunit-domain-containing protein n=1 Tax=Lipomyces arxii TaxID=56418 RepID=UPI0034CE4BEC